MDWSQYRHHCIWLQTLRIREDTVVSCVFQLSVSMPSTTVSSLLLFGFGTNCRLQSLCPLPSRPISLHCWASRRLRCQFTDIQPVFILHSSTFLSVCGFIVCFPHFMHICHARHYSTLRNVHYRKRRKKYVRKSKQYNFHKLIALLHAHRS